MKNIIRALTFISISLVALNCSNDESIPAQGKVQFALAITSSSADGGRVLSQSFPTGSYISLSIETASGTPVFSLEHVDLIQLADGYLTSPLDLTEGSYRLTDFFVMSASGEVLYATPKEGSDLAGLVEDPLPIQFSIEADGILNLSVQVVDVDQQVPGDFGYVAFGAEVIGAYNDYDVTVFIAEGDELSLASAKLALYQGDYLLYEQNLDAKVNAVNFKGDPDATYTLFVNKKGYTTKSREFVLRDLLEELDGKPWKFILEPSFTMTLKHKRNDRYPDNRLMSFSIQLTGVPGTAYEVAMDWGDGTIDPIEGNYQDNGTTPYIYVQHLYSESLLGKPGYINMTGDLLHVSDVSLYNPHPLSISDVDLTRLTNLDKFSWDTSLISIEDAPDHFDISKNPNMTMLLIKETRITSLDISNNPVLTRISVTDTYLSSEELNKLIMDLPERAGLERSDFFGWGISIFSNQQNVARLTEESRLKLQRLRDNYNWYIYPDPQ